MRFPVNDKQAALQRLKWELAAVSVYRRVLDRPVTSALTEAIGAAVQGGEAALCGSWGRLCAALTAADKLDSLPAAIGEEVLGDDNAYCAALSAGETPSPRLEAAALRDLGVLYRAACLTPQELSAGLEPSLAESLPGWGNDPAPAPLDIPWGQQPEHLAAYHAAHGCGRFARNMAFLWREGRLIPVDHPDPIRLSNLKSYEYQRQIAVNNTLSFLNGFEANNMLLYGDRGTGKSSTVKALLNEFAPKGLRMIEMPKESLHDLPRLTEYLAGIPMKFIVFIDDLSFSAGDDNFAALKAVLEGGLASRPANVLIYATSNRRHLLRETFSDREGDDVHHADTVQESVSLSDRFGISLTFLLPDKQRFLEIVEQIAADRGLQVDRQTLLSAAERWALERGARSPRYARQFIADAQARLARGEAL